MDAKEIYLSRPWLRYYPQGVPPEVEIPQQSVPELLDEVSERHPSKAALIFYGKKLTYADLRRLVDQFATALTDLGIRKGDTVALHLLNCPQYVIAYYAALKLGAVVTPISPVYTSKEVKHQLIDSGAKTVICQDILYDNVEKSGVEIDNLILTNISEYLPWLKKFLGKSALGKVYRGNAGSGTRGAASEKAFISSRTSSRNILPNRPRCIFSRIRIQRCSRTQAEQRDFPKRPYLPTGT